MRTDQAPFNDVRVRRAISQAVDRQGSSTPSFSGRAEPAMSPGLAEWSPPSTSSARGRKYYQHDPQEARRLLAEAGFPNGLKTL